jgi:hypothetical protein
MAKASVGMEMVNAKEFNDAMEQLDRLVRFKVIDKALKAGSKPVETTMRAIAPDSRKTGSRAKQSRAVKTKFANSKPLKTTIRTVIRKSDKGGIAITGPSYTHGGGHGNFFASDHKRKVLWGRDGGETRKMNQFVKATADQTKAAASAAMTAVVKSEVAAAAKEASRG